MITETDADYIGYNVQNALGHVTYEVARGFFNNICIEFVDTEYAWMGNTQTKDRDTAIVTFSDSCNGRRYHAGGGCSRRVGSGSAYGWCGCSAPPVGALRSNARVALR